MTSKVRVRFAPSPTGPLHIGGLRTALYNYLFAKKHEGDFVLRLEDTDQNRFVAGAEEYIIEALEWAGIPFDEGPGKENGFGPYKQSERKEIYNDFVKKLLDTGKAYYAFDTAEELKQIRKEYEEKGETFSYNWENRARLNNSLSLSEEEVKQKLENEEKYVIRFKPERDEELVLEDLVRGTIRVNTDAIDDKVLYKSDGMPTYHMANIIDDHLMEITHVIRGEEWLPSLGLHVLLYRAFGWQAPKFAHLPLILKPVGKGKLSKRDGDKLGFPVFPIEWKDPSTGEVASGYRESGYFPEAVINMLALLGWNPGEGSEKEIFSLEELIDAFDIDNVSKAGAKFSYDKTLWFQHQYMQKKDSFFLAEKYLEILSDKGIEVSIAFVEKVVKSIQERANFIDDLWDLSYFFFQAPKELDKKAVKKAWKKDTGLIITEIKLLIEEVEEFTQENLGKIVRDRIKEKEIGFGKVMMPLRLCLVGKMMGPDVFEIMELLGKKETIDRMEYAIKTLA
ncbi:MAG TPA: glutamate--tRNA ligase [Flavobacteriaceae bacterium]|nr:glutamate--tRNA ligase [Flavobacteriaceae bacterium]